MFNQSECTGEVNELVYGPAVTSPRCDLRPFTIMQVVMMSLFLQRCHQRLCHRPCSQRLCEVRCPHSNPIFVIEISQHVNPAVFVRRRRHSQSVI